MLRDNATVSPTAKTCPTKDCALIARTVTSIAESAANAYVNLNVATVKSIVRMVVTKEVVVSKICIQYSNQFFYNCFFSNILESMILYDL